MATGKLLMRPSLRDLTLLPQSHTVGFMQDTSPTIARARTDKARATNDKILATAMRLVDAAGRADTVTADVIATEAGVSVGRLYTAWRSKDALLVDCLVHRLATGMPITRPWAVLILRLHELDITDDERVCYLTVERQARHRTGTPTEAVDADLRWLGTIAQVARGVEVGHE